VSEFQNGRDNFKTNSKAFELSRKCITKCIRYDVSSSDLV